jgi:hypothetical protein
MDGKAGLPPSLEDQETTNQFILQPVAKLNPEFLLSSVFLGSNETGRSRKPGDAEQCRQP